MQFNALSSERKQKAEHSLIYVHTHTTKHLTLLAKNRKAQSALEYMMTYGWAILIIVIVAVILYSMGIFNPSSSITTTSIGFSPFTVSSTVCSPAGVSVAIIGGGLPDTATSATISKIYIISNTGTTALTKEYNLTPVVIFPGKTATIIIPTVACASANVKYSLSAKLQYSYSTPAGSVTTNTTGTIAGASSSQAIVKYVPLTITSSTATPNPFQQMVIVNMNNYNSYASSNLSNIEFTYPNGTIIPSWRENGTTNTQTVVYWLKLGSFTTATVYMDFFSTSSNVLNSVNTGEAPQIPCGSTPTSSCSNYGEYDDGANIFNNYWNFAGTSLPSGFSTYMPSSGASITVNNGLTLQTTTGYQLNIFTNIVYPQNGAVIESYVNTNAIYTNGGLYAANTVTTGGLWGGSNGYLFNWVGTNAGTSNTGLWKTVGGSITHLTTPTQPSAGYQIIGLQISLSGHLGFFVNYNLLSSTTDTSVSYSSLNQLVLFQNGISDMVIFYQYVRVRAYPPNGVMPTVSFGSLV